MKTLLKPPTYSFAQTRQSFSDFCISVSAKDALYFHLYGLNGEEANEILATFFLQGRSVMQKLSALRIDLVNT